MATERERERRRQEREAERELKRIFDPDYDRRAAEGAFYRERYERMKQAVAEQPTLLGVPKKQCVACGSTDDVQQHHLDWNRSNNEPSNLAWICKWCHADLHRNQGYMSLEDLRAGNLGWRQREREQDREELEGGE